jgi:hypothetical protein
MQKTETDDSDWLTVANGLAHGSDAGASVELLATLAIALPKKPSGVLQAAEQGNFLTVDEICGAPFIEPEHAVMLRYLTATRRSPIGLKDTAAEQNRAKCLGQIGKLLSEAKSP